MNSMNLYTAYRIVQLADLPIYRIEQYELGWNGKGKWRPYRERHYYHGGRTLWRIPEYSSFKEAWKRLEGVEAENREQYFRSSGAYWNEVK